MTDSWHPAASDINHAQTDADKECLLALSALYVGFLSHSVESSAVGGMFFIYF